MVQIVGRLPRFPTWILVFSGLLFVLALQCLNDPGYVWQEISFLAQAPSERSIARIGLYLAAYLLSVLAVFSFVFTKGAVFPSLFGLVLVGHFTLDLSFQLLGTRTGFDFNEYELIRDAVGMAANIVVYAGVILQALLLSLGLLALLIAIRSRVPAHRRSHLWLLVPPFATVVVAILSIKVFSINAYNFPALVKVPSVIAHFESESNERDLLTRQFDSALAVERSSFKDIIWIIDESVTATYLGINGYGANTTPYLNAVIAGDDAVNFGVATSAGGHSALSNLALRIGLQPKHAGTFATSRATLPTIYQHARHAGYRTTLIDLQMSNGQLQNFLSREDLQYIDKYLTAGRATKLSIRDREAIEDIKTLVRGPEKNFIVLIKWGSHWPYQYTYPESEEFFTPALQSAWGSMSEENREATINTYLNSLRYAADGFLKEFLDKIDLSDRMILYTADHGQSLETPGTLRTHGGNEEDADSVGAVPLIVFARNAKRLFTGIEPNRYSSFQIFNTTLKLMGYGDEYVATYGPSLLSVPPPEYRSYFAASDGRLQPANPSAITYPPSGLPRH